MLIFPTTLGDGNSFPFSEEDAGVQRGDLTLPWEAGKAFCRAPQVGFPEAGKQFYTKHGEGAGVVVLPRSSLRRRCLTGPQRKSSLTRELGGRKEDIRDTGHKLYKVQGQERK